ncbi:MAG: sigma-70 family RNA polymerase sigma factor, partial [Planctomycetes bacterium]|nr:sigma-70 family RNA polymerase sigma factor [Planctomycetota bacterium]
MLNRLGLPDRLLRRYSRTGDPRLLGRLFDRTAPELLRVALWLCRNRDDAEDLLQRTFVTVIEVRERYDSKRRALPWLCGILGNHARKLHARRDRGRLCATDPVRERDPSDEAAVVEFHEILARLRGDVGEPYSEVLDLHLGRGLDAGEIATLLDRPASTVRTQLARGMDRLRRRLPRGLIAGIAPALVLSTAATAALLSAARAVVMQ